MTRRTALVLSLLVSLATTFAWWYWVRRHVPFERPAPTQRVIG